MLFLVTGGNFVVVISWLLCDAGRFTRIFLSFLASSSFFLCRFNNFSYLKILIIVEERERQGERQRNTETETETDSET